MNFFRPLPALAFVTGILFLSPGLSQAQDADLSRIKTQFVERLLSSSPSSDARFATTKTKSVAAWMDSLTPDGQWSDIRYDDRTRGAWSTAGHLARVLEMAKAYVSPSSTFHRNPLLLKAIHSSLDLWLAKDYLNPNWWYNEIGIPMNMAAILVLMEPELSAAELGKGIQIVSRAKIGMTGQNKIWLAGNVLSRALLQQDAALVQKARDVINAEIAVSSAEGLQIDNSFHQHGPQLQQGNYGLAFASDCVAWMETLRGTRLALSPDKTIIVRNYLLQGENAVVWNGMMDISACGRHLFPNSPASKARSVGRFLAFLEKNDPAFAPAYQKALRSYNGHTAPEDQITGNRLFWRSDYLVDRRPDYYASVKMSSPRTIGTELVNQENLSGRYLGDGALYLYKTGKEYENIFPVWDWCKIPGVTCAATGPVRPSSNRNLGDFTGGVTDGHNGATVLDYDRDGVKAKKSWFFFAGRIVCLGAGITAESDQAVSTAINQCLLNGAVIAGHDHQADPVPDGRREYPALQWAWHDGVGYVFPQPAKITLGGTAQTGSWANNVYSAGSADPVTRNVFSIWIDHGTRPRDAAYAYVLLPSATQPQVQAFAKTPDTEILSNTASLQAVRCGSVTSAVFYQPGQLEYAPGLKLAVDQPCLLLIAQCPAGPKLTVADPTQKLPRLLLTWKNRPIPIELHRGTNAGSSVNVPQ